MPSRQDLTLQIVQLTVEYANLNKFPDNLCGLCAISSAALFQAMLINDEIYKTRYEPSYLYGTVYNSHCWVESQGIVYDTTYKQFKYSKNFHIGKRTVKHEDYARSHKVITSLAEMEHWDMEQRPTQERINWYLERLFDGTKFKLSNNKQNKLRNNRDKYYSFAAQIERKSKLLPDKSEGGLLQDSIGCSTITVKW